MTLKNKLSQWLFPSTLTCLSFNLLADPLNDDIERIRVQGSDYQTGQYVSASAGWVSGNEINSRPLSRVGEILEFVPGMMVTQHSGSGKANQYFLRGFNLDHGTDFATFVDGMPVNMRTHGHGQGYSDINFIIPEMIDNLSFYKGTYYADIGDFSGAGGARFALKNALDTSQIDITLGQNDYLRSVFLGQQRWQQTTFIGAVEYQQYDGPWVDVSEDIDKLNANLRVVTPLLHGTFTLTGMAYDNTWNGADQIPSRAVEQGWLSPLGSIDTDAGGTSSRYSLSGNYQDDIFTVSAYIIDSQLDLFSNFTYFLADPLNGDEFEQVDQRRIYGADTVAKLHLKTHTIRIGAQWRFDDIDEVGLYQTSQRQRLSTVRTDRVQEHSLAVFSDIELNLLERWIVNLGIRYDQFYVDVVSDTSQNTGKANSGIGSVKAAVKYQASDTIALYANVGQGFHSNDARGVVSQIDPITKAPISPADMLVRSTGSELGISWTDSYRFNVSAALWHLTLDSELVYVGDAGMTEASRPSSRYGIEAAAYFWLGHHWVTDIEAAYTKARFSDSVTDEGTYIDGTVPVVINTGISWFEQSNKMGWSVSTRVRYLGDRVVDSYNKISTDDTLLTNLLISHQWQHFRLVAEVLNVFDSRDHDIDYFYASRLPQEPQEGIEDIHYHPVEPRTVRLSMEYRF